MIAVVRVRKRTYIGNESDEQSWREETGRFLCISLVCFTSANITKSIIMTNTIITNYMLTTHYAHPGELPAPNVPPFTAFPGVAVSLLKDAKPLHFFQLFLSTQLITYIVECTNAYATTRLGLMPPSRRSLFRSWKPATFVEIKAVVGVILNMGLIQLSQLKDYWMMHEETINLQFFRRVFSRDRFLQLFWMLHVGEVNGLTRHSKIQPLLDMIIPSFQRLFVPGKALAVDEAMIAYRGRVSFRQYTRGKPHP